jgi:endonuclease/exonuclease/phosphatase family metal-dependent hydrolase
MIRLVTFNVQHGRTASGEVDPERLAAAVASLGADVVALQEVDRLQERSGGADLARVVAEAMGAREYRYLPALAGPLALPKLAGQRAGARTMLGADGRHLLASQLRTGGSRYRARGDEPPDVPGYGIAILSRHPVSVWRRLRLPVGSPWLCGRIPLGPDEPRSALAAVVETPEGPLTVVNTHLSSWRSWNRVQLRVLQRRLVGVPRPLVLLGDLNIRGDIPARVTGWRELVHTPTFPARRPRVQIDHVLVDSPDGAVEPVGPARALDLGLSDHRAVVVDVTLARQTH